jgi:hypothetical protein
MKRRYVTISIACSIIIFFAYYAIGETSHNIQFQACKAKLAKLKVESARISPGNLVPFQLSPINESTRYKSSLFGFKDTKGNLVLSPNFTQARAFSEGRSAVSNRNWYWGFMDSTGKMITPYNFTGVSDFHDGLAAFAGIKDKDISGFVNRNGQIEIELDTNPGEYFTGDFYGFKDGYIETSKSAWDPLNMHDNPHPSISVKIDCTGRVIYGESLLQQFILTTFNL